MTDLQDIHVDLTTFEDRLNMSDTRTLYLYLPPPPFEVNEEIITQNGLYNKIKNHMVRMLNNPENDISMIQNKIKNIFYNLTTEDIPMRWPPRILEYSRFDVISALFHYFIYERHMPLVIITEEVIKMILLNIYNRFVFIMGDYNTSSNTSIFEFNKYADCLLCIMLDILHIPELNELHVPLCTNIINNMIVSLQRIPMLYNNFEIWWCKCKIETSLNRFGRYILYNLRNNDTLFLILTQLLHINTVFKIRDSIIYYNDTKPLSFDIIIRFYNGQLNDRETDIRECYRVFFKHIINRNLSKSENKLQHNIIGQLIGVTQQPRFLVNIQSLKDI